MSPEIPTRVAVVAALRESLREELAAVESVAAMARDEVSSEETRSEGKYDTRATEASYLARGQAWRVAALRRQLAWAEVFDPERPLSPPVVQVGALVQLLGEREEWVFVAPVGGANLDVGGVTVKVISPASPLGQAISELEAGEAAEVDTPRGLVELEVGAVV